MLLFDMAFQLSAGVVCAMGSREALSAPSVKLMKTVAAAIKEDLARVKDVLDIFVRTGMNKSSELVPQLDLLKKISDTLGVLGLGHDARTPVPKGLEYLGLVVADARNDTQPGDDHTSHQGPFPRSGRCGSEQADAQVFCRVDLAAPCDELGIIRIGVDRTLATVLDAHRDKHHDAGGNCRDGHDQPTPR